MYSLFTSFSEIRKLPVPDLRTPPRPAAAAADHILWSLSLSRRGDTPYVVFYPVPDGRVLHTGKQRNDYFLTVLHFRKVVIRQTVGSVGNGPPVIYRNCYMTTYYHLCNVRRRKDKKGNIQAGDRLRVVQSIVLCVIITLSDYFFGKYCRGQKWTKWSFFVS